MSYKNLVVEENASWLEVQIDRQKALNALNHDTMNDLDALVDEVHGKDEIRGVILTGAGEKAFVAGADIGELSDLSAEQAMAHAARGQGVFSKIENARKPFIAAVNGFALGGGLELAMSCHVRVFVSSASVGLPEVGLGVIPGYGGTQRLGRIVGLGRALEMTLTGNMIDAEEAYRIGLANKVVEAKELMETCRGIAASMNKRGPRAVSLALQAAVRGRDMPLAEGLAFEVSQFGLAANTDDWKEGTDAFLSKRKPEFKGK